MRKYLSFLFFFVGFCAALTGQSSDPSSNPQYREAMEQVQSSQRYFTYSLISLAIVCVLMLVITIMKRKKRR